MGEPKGEAGVRLHDVVFAVRQHSSEGVSEHAGEDLVQRQPGDVLGAGEICGQNASGAHGPQFIAAENEYGPGGAWRSFGKVRPVERSGVRLFLSSDADGDTELGRGRAKRSVPSKNAKGRRFRLP